MNKIIDEALYQSIDSYYNGIKDCNNITNNREYIDKHERYFYKFLTDNLANTILIDPFKMNPNKRPDKRYDNSIVTLKKRIKKNIEKNHAILHCNFINYLMANIDSLWMDYQNFDQEDKITNIAKDDEIKHKITKWLCSLNESTYLIHKKDDNLTFIDQSILDFLELHLYNLPYYKIHALENISRPQYKDLDPTKREERMFKNIIKEEMFNIIPIHYIKILKKKDYYKEELIDASIHKELLSHYDLYLKFLAEEFSILHLMYQLEDVNQLRKIIKFRWFCMTQYANNFQEMLLYMISYVRQNKLSNQHGKICNELILPVLEWNHEALTWKIDCLMGSLDLVHFSSNLIFMTFLKEDINKILVDFERQRQLVAYGFKKKPEKEKKTFYETLWDDEKTLLRNFIDSMQPIR